MPSNYVVCCPTSFGGSSHMTMSSTFSNKKEADKYGNHLKKTVGDFKAYAIGSGPKSTVYSVPQNASYSNTRAPHVTGAPFANTTIYCSNPYTYKIGK